MGRKEISLINNSISRVSFTVVVHSDIELSNDVTYK